MMPRLAVLGRPDLPVLEVSAVVALGALVMAATLFSPIAAIAIGGAAVFLALGLVNIRVFVACAFATVAMPRLYPPGTTLPVNEMLVGLTIVALVITGRAAQRRSPWWFTVLLGGLVGTLAASMLVNTLLTVASSKRMAHILLFAVVAVCLGNGFIPFRPVVRGLGAGLMIGFFFGLLALTTGIGAKSYTGRLTGYLFGEPNFAGFLLAAAGPVVAVNIRRAWVRNAFIAVALIGIALTFSRTAYLAVLLAGLWVVLGRRVRPSLALGVLSILVVCVTFLPADIHTAGPFSTRVGSDNLRTRILAAETVSIRQAPLLGHGPGTATVELPGQAPLRFYFHSSYYALVQEGGAIALVAMIGLLFMVLLKLSTLAPHRRSPLLEASIIAVAVCGVSLGEVLLDLTAAIALGAAVRHVMIQSRSDDEIDLTDGARPRLAIDA